MTNTFKAGDRVRFKAGEPRYRFHNGYINPGDTGTVERVSPSFVFVKLDKSGGVAETFARRWEAAPAAASVQAVGTLKVGDKVRLNDDFMNVRKGTEGEVASVDVADRLMTYQVRFPSGSRVGFSGGAIFWCYNKDLEAVGVVTAPAPEAPARVRADTSRQHWIIALLSPTGIPLPGTEPMTHGTEAAATTEATRLMNANPGKTFVVYRAAKSFTMPTAAARVTTF